MKTYYQSMKDIWSANYPSIETPDEIIASYKSMGLDSASGLLDPLMEKVPLHHKRILDFGTDNGVMLTFFEKYGVELHGIDINEDAIRDGKERFPSFHLKTYDGEALPYEEDYFDMVFASAVLKHIRYEDRAAVYKELGRVARYLIVFELNSEKRFVEEAHGFKFYHANFRKELAEYFTPVQVRESKGYLFALYQSP